MPSINSVTEACRAAVDEAVARTALVTEIYMLEQLGKCLDRADSLDSVRAWQRDNLAFLRSAQDA